MAETNNGERVRLRWSVNILIILVVALISFGAVHISVSKSVKENTQTNAVQDSKIDTITRDIADIKQMQIEIYKLLTSKQ